MPRRELLVMGFRHTKTMAKNVRSKSNAAAVAGKRLADAGALPAKAAAPSKATQTKQPVAQRGNLDGSGAKPSFAASSVAAPPAAAGRSPGVVGTLLKSAAAAARPSQSPSFAASPVWGGRAAAQPAAQEAGRAGAGAGAAAPAAARTGRLPAAVTRNPLWRLAQLGAPAASTPAAPSKAAEHQALARYAQLGDQPAAKTAAKKLGAAAALLRYARLK